MLRNGFEGGAAHGLVDPAGIAKRRRNGRV
jgi:hypothetical protein